MPRNPQLQEVIIVSSSRFANRSYVEKNTSHNGEKTNDSKKNSLKDACWNGMLKDILPELFLHFSTEDKLFLWQMRECRNVFTMELSEKPGDLDFQASIDPYCFMELQEYN
jgi:hypothetical protein